jgi:hypothetical protein
MEVDESLVSKNTKAEQETLFLIYKYLNSINSCKETSEKLRHELQQNFLLGDVHSWDGSCKKADIQDMDRKYSHVPNDMLLSLLHTASAVENPTPHSSIITTAAAACQTPTVEDLLSYHELLTQLKITTVNQSKHRMDIVQTEARLNKLNELIDLHTNYDDTTGAPRPPDVDISSFMTHLTARDISDIYAKDANYTPSGGVLEQHKQEMNKVFTLNNTTLLNTSLHAVLHILKSIFDM